MDFSRPEYGIVIPLCVGEYIKSNTCMKSRIPPLQDDALIVVERPGVHMLHHTLKMKACLYTGENFRKIIAKKSIENQGPNSRS